MKIRIRDGAIPLKMKARRYNGPQRKFLNEYMRKLLDKGFVEKRSTASWQTTPLIVPKPGKKDEYGMAVDLQPCCSCFLFPV